MATIADQVAIRTADLYVNQSTIVFQKQANDIWQIICGAFVFFMHAGFTMLEAGSIHKTSVANIMFKNVATVAIGVITYWFLGFGFAFPDDNDGDNDDLTFIGAGDFLGRAEDQAFWFFQMVFAATSATIVSGAVGGRIQLGAYFLATTILTAFVYPVVSHWIFDNGGFLSAFTISDRLSFGGDTPCGTIDFAGSGVVHMTGGVAAFWGAFILGPRTGWTPENAGRDFPGHNWALSALGTIILWFGWYGFNPGSTLVWDGTAAGQVAITTTIAPGISCLVGVFITKLRTGEWDLGSALNSILAGLVAVTAPCATVRPGFAFIIGVIAAIVYHFGSRLNRKVIKLDDPVDAVPVHGYCGFLGLISAGLFSDGELVEATYAKECDTNVGSLLLYQVIAAIVIFIWVSAYAILTFGALRMLKKLRLSDEEQQNIDINEHGIQAYEKM